MYLATGREDCAKLDQLGSTSLKKRESAHHPRLVAMASAQPSSIAQTFGEVVPDSEYSIANVTTSVENNDWVLIVDAVILVSRCCACFAACCVGVHTQILTSI